MLGRISPRAVAGGAFFEDFDIHLRTDALAGDLDQSEFAGRKDRMFGAVLAHLLF